MKDCGLVVEMEKNLKRVFGIGEGEEDGVVSRRKMFLFLAVSGSENVFFFFLSIN